MKAKVAEHYQEHFRTMFKLANSRVDNTSDAEDILSDACITVLRQVETGKLTKEEDIGRYFTTCITSRAIDFKRSADKHGVVDNELESGVVLEQQVDLGMSPEEHLEKDQEGRELEDRIDLVKNANKRLILSKAFLHGLRPAAIASDMGMSKRYVNRVMEEFREGYDANM